MKVLIVDDSSTIRNIAKSELLKGNHEVLEAKSGEEALEIVSTIAVDLVTLDVEMPGVNGYEVCKRLQSPDYIQSSPNKKAVPVVFLTSNDSLEERQRGFDAGALDFISKPFKPGQLLFIVNQILKPQMTFMGLTTLIVDDSRTVRSLLTGILEKEGLSLIEAEDGQKAFDIFRSRMNEIDLVITDYSMPVMSGKALCGKIREELKDLSTPIIFLSATSDQSKILQMFQTGASDYIVKPFTKEELLARVKVHLNMRMLFKEVKRSESHIKAVVDNVVDGIVTIDRKGSINRFNPGAEKIFGYSSQEVLGKNVKMLMPDPYHSNHDMYLLNFLKTGVPKVIGMGREVEGLKKDGTVFPIDLAVGQIKVGNEIEFVGVMRDITLRKNMEAEILRQNNSLKELNETKNKFLGMAAHDLRNPLASIRGFSELMLDDDLDQETQTEFKKLIYSVSNEMLTILNDLLDISQIESGQLAIKLNAKNLAEIVRRRVHLSENIAKKKGMALKVELGECPETHFDNERIGQVLDNFISNAIKFSPHDSSICIRLSKTAGYARVEVQDQGPGIPEDEVNKLFGEFQTLSTRPTAGEKSTGLGLAIVKKIISAHGGKVGVESKVGLGSTFYFCLPLSI